MEAIVYSKPADLPGLLVRFMCPPMARRSLTRDASEFVKDYRPSKSASIRVNVQLRLSAPTDATDYKQRTTIREVQK
jgi:hypothetical protein